MKKSILLIVLGIMILLVSGFIQRKKTYPPISYPEGYRHWTHIKSGIVGPTSPAAPKYEGFTHIYANEKAMSGYRTGNFPNGSVIVFDVLESKTGKNGIAEGERKFIDVMVKDSVRHGSTGGWGYEEFDKNTHSPGVLKEADQKTCFGCHQSRKNQDYVFSVYRQ